MSDKIIVRNLAVFAYHGALAEEATLGQRFVLSFEGMLDLQPAGGADDLAASVSYADMIECVQEQAVMARFSTLEALAEHLAKTLLARFARLDAVTMRVEKPGAPVAAIFDYAAVEITRWRAAQSRQGTPHA